MATFGNIGAITKVRLSQLTPQENMWYYFMGDWIATVSSSGLEDNENKFSYDGGHWYRYNAGMLGELADDVEIELNRGIVIYSSMGAYINFSGEVVRGNSELYTASAANAYTGNFTPVKITLGDIVPQEGMWYWYMGDWLGTIGATGLEDVKYTYDSGNWYTRDSATGMPIDLANDVEIQPGQGFIVYTSMGASVSIPGAID